MKRFLLVCAVLCVLVKSASAEQATTNWTEPTASGTLAYTTMYWCVGVGCTDWKTGSEFRRNSDNGNGGDAKSHVMNVPLVQGTLPQTFRVKITATDTSLNESSGTIVQHVFSN